MPLAKWKTFGQCVGAQKRMGHSDISSRKICGRIQADTEGASGSSSSQEAAAGFGNDSMSQDQEMEGAAGSITFSPEEMTAIIQAASDEGANKTLALLKQKVNVEEEGEQQTPNRPPAKKPPFMR